MGHYEASVEIDAPPERVWELISDIKRYPEWIAVTDRIVSGGDEPAQLGAVWREYGGPARFLKSESEWRATEFDPPRRHVQEGHGQGVDRILVTTTLTPAGEGTRMHYVLDIKTKWYWLPISWPLELLILNRLSHRLMRKTVDDAKTLIEAEQS